VAEIENTPTPVGGTDWYLLNGVIYQGHGDARERVATVHGELIPHREVERRGRLIVNAERLAETLRDVQANLTGRDCFPERVADSLRRIERTLAVVEGRAN
jgi:hypothetical protein